MNILPLVFALMLILSVLTIEKLDRFKSMILVQSKYKEAIQKQDRQAFNREQEAIYNNLNKRSRISYRKLSFRPFLKKDQREGSHIEKYRQIRQITIDLIEVLYGKAPFYKKMQEKRPNFVEEMLNAIEETSDQMPKDSIKRIEDIVRIKLEDPDLQSAFYHMLKGTIGKDTLKYESSPDIVTHERAYIPLLTFIHFDGVDKKIKLGLAPRELLLAIYGNPELVQKLIDMRNELGSQLVAEKISTKDEATAKFQAEFEGKQKQGITDVLDYSMTKSYKQGRE